MIHLWICFKHGRAIMCLSHRTFLPWCGWLHHIQ